jgi:transcription antitermination factor NusA-like protein
MVELEIAQLPENAIPTSTGKLTRQALIDFLIQQFEKTADNKLVPRIFTVSDVERFLDLRTKSSHQEVYQLIFYRNADLVKRVGKDKQVYLTANTQNTELVEKVKQHWSKRFLAAEAYDKPEENFELKEKLSKSYREIHPFLSIVIDKCEVSRNNEKIIIKVPAEFNQYVGRLIGKEGCNVKNVSQKIGLPIVITRESKPQSEATDYKAFDLKENLREAYYEIHPFLGLVIDKCEVSRVGHIVCIKVPDEFKQFVGRLIGKEGRNVKNVSQKIGVPIKITSESKPPEDFDTELY